MDFEQVPELPQIKEQYAALKQFSTRCYNLADTLEKRYNEEDDQYAKRVVLLETREASAAWLYDLATQTYAIADATRIAFDRLADRLDVLFGELSLMQLTVNCHHEKVARSYLSQWIVRPKNFLDEKLRNGVIAIRNQSPFLTDENRISPDISRRLASCVAYHHARPVHYPRMMQIVGMRRVGQVNLDKLDCVGHSHSSKPAMLKVDDEDKCSLLSAGNSSIGAHSTATSRLHFANVVISVRPRLSIDHGSARLASDKSLLPCASEASLQRVATVGPAQIKPSLRLVDVAMSSIDFVQTIVEAESSLFPEPPDDEIYDEPTSPRHRSSQKHAAAFPPPPPTRISIVPNAEEVYDTVDAVANAGCVGRPDHRSRLSTLSVRKCESYEGGKDELNELYGETSVSIDNQVYSGAPVDSPEHLPLPDWVPGPCFGKAIAAYSYTRQQDDELSFEKGTAIYVLSTEDPVWWHGVIAPGVSGLFPSQYVTPPVKLLD